VAGFLARLLANKRSHHVNFGRLLLLLLLDGALPHFRLPNHFERSVQTRIAPAQSIVVVVPVVSAMDSPPPLIESERAKKLDK
jgi:hypothetical protein